MGTILIGRHAPGSRLAPRGTVKRQPRGSSRMRSGGIRRPSARTAGGFTPFGDPAPPFAMLTLRAGPDSLDRKAASARRDWVETRHGHAAPPDHPRLPAATPSTSRTAGSRPGSRRVAGFRGRCPAGGRAGGGDRGGQSRPAPRGPGRDRDGPATPRVSVRAAGPPGPARRAGVESLRTQSFGDYEVLAIGEGAGAIAAAASDPGCGPCARMSRRGAGGRRPGGRGRPARRRPQPGHRRGRAEWVAFLDPGDAWREDHLAELVAATRFGDAVAVFGNPVAAGRPAAPADERASGRVSDPFAFALRVGRVPVRASAPWSSGRRRSMPGCSRSGAAAGRTSTSGAALALQGPFRYVRAATALVGPAAPPRVPAPPLLAATLGGSSTRARCRPSSRRRPGAAATG